MRYPLLENCWPHCLQWYWYFLSPHDTIFIIFCCWFVKSKGNRYINKNFHYLRYSLGNYIVLIQKRLMGKYKFLYPGCVFLFSILNRNLPRLSEWNGHSSHMNIVWLATHLNVEEWNKHQPLLRRDKHIFWTWITYNKPSFCSGSCDEWQATINFQKQNNLETRDRKNIFWLAANDFWVKLAVNMLSPISSKLLLICLFKLLIGCVPFCVGCWLLLVGCLLFFIGFIHFFLIDSWQLIIIYWLHA